MITPDHAATFERCMAVGGVAVFGADTVYGLACEPDNPEAVARLRALRGPRHASSGEPLPVLFFHLDLALAAAGRLGARTVAALEGLLPGPATVLLPNPEHRFPLACGSRPDTLAVRVPALAPGTEDLALVRWPVLEERAGTASANAPAATLLDVAAPIRAEADLLLDAGQLPGVQPTVVDLCAYERDGSWAIVRDGAMPAGDVEIALAR